MLTSLIPLFPASQMLVHCECVSIYIDLVFCWYDRGIVSQILFCKILAAYYLNVLRRDPTVGKQVIVGIVDNFFVHDNHHVAWVSWYDKYIAYLRQSLYALHVTIQRSWACIIHDSLQIPLKVASTVIFSFLMWCYQYGIIAYDLYPVARGPFWEWDFQSASLFKVDFGILLPTVEIFGSESDCGIGTLLHRCYPHIEHTQGMRFKNIPLVVSYYSRSFSGKVFM